MKKISLVLVLLFFVALTPLYGLYCSECERSLPTQARFCPWCGTSATVDASIPTATMETALQRGTVSQPALGFSPASYLYVNQFEELLRRNDLAETLKQAQDLWRLNDIQASRAISARGKMNRYQRKLHDLYARKFDLLNDYLEAWRKEQEEQDQARAIAEKQKTAFAIALINTAIDELIIGNGSESSFSRVEVIERRIKKSSSNNRVTAAYLLIGDNRLQRGESIWVIEIAGSYARIMHMGEGKASKPLSGWVTLYDLENRTNWRPDPAIFHTPPSKPLVFSALQLNPTRVVIFTEDTNPRHDYDRRRYLRIQRRANKRNPAVISHSRTRKPHHIGKEPYRKHRTNPKPRISMHRHSRP